MSARGAAAREVPGGRALSQSSEEAVQAGGEEYSGSALAGVTRPGLLPTVAVLVLRTAVGVVPGGLGAVPFGDGATVTRLGGVLGRGGSADLGEVGLGTRAPALGPQDCADQHTDRDHGHPDAQGGVVRVEHHTGRDDQGDEVHHLEQRVDGRARGVLEGVADGVTDDRGLVGGGALAAVVAVLHELLGVVPGPTGIGQEHRHEHAGGDGTAESRYLETVLLAQQQLIEFNRWAMEHFSWDLFLAYSPFPDEAEHVWRGYLDPALAGHRPDIAERLFPFLSAVYHSCDEFLGLFMSNRPVNTVIALVSDHGLEGANKLIAINRALQRDGLLETDPRGFVDLSRTKVIYPAMNNGYFLLNTTDRKGGIVAPAERAQVVQQLRDLLLSLRDGDKPIIHRVYDSESDGVKLGIGGEGGGDIYLEPVSGYDFDVRWDAEVSSGELITSRPPIGTHGLSPDRPSMRTLMVLNGPGVTPGRRFHDARITDFAPTLAKLLRIPAPKHATGRILEEVLDHRALTRPVDVD